jgi:hypothetical protein
MLALSHHRFLKAVQGRSARVAVSASATRNQGGGIVQPARAFFAVMPLKNFCTANEAHFAQRLNTITRELQATFPPQASSWGLARKLLNIFLRDCLYTCYLNDAYKLSIAEKFMELPLDSISAGFLFKEAPKLSLPKWPGVKYNTPELSIQYQAFASRLAAKAGVARVHLDTYVWGERLVHGDV